MDFETRNLVIFTVKEALGLVYPETRESVVKSIMKSYGSNPPQGRPYFQEASADTPTGEDSSDKDEDEVFVYQDQNFLLQDKVYGIDYETCYTMVEEDVSDPDAGPSPYSYYLLTACMQGCGSLGGCIVTRNGDSSTLHSIDRSNTPVEGWRDFTEFLYKCADEIYPYLASDTRVFMDIPPLPKYSLSETDEFIRSACGKSSILSEEIFISR